MTTHANNPNSSLRLGAGALWVAGLVLLGGAVTPAHAAERVVLFAPVGDPGLAVDQAEAHAALARLLRASGRDVDEVRPDDDAQAGTCTDLGCADALVRERDASFATGVSVWADAAGKLDAVVVTLVERSGERYPGRATAGDAGSLDGAVEAALRDARALRLLGPGPWVHVRTQPSGAEVHLDGEYVGTAPYRAPVAAGHHRVEVLAAGHVSQSRELDVPGGTAQQIDVRLRLPASGSGARPEPPAPAAVAAPRPSATRPWVGPAIVAGLGVALAAATTLDIIVSGSGCHTAAGGACLSERAPNPAPVAIYYSLSAAAVGGAVLWHFLGGSEEDEASSGAVSMRVGPTGASMVGRF